MISAKRFIIRARTNLLKYWLFCLILLAGFIPSGLRAAVVINEIMYDPSGIDTGNEWLELYNNGSTSVELEGAVLQAGGSQFSTIFTFPHYVLRPGRFILIGEENISQATFFTSLVMQNGGAETDGVRYISAEGDYTDTVLYDEPNTSNLPDDSGNTGLHFAEDVPAGFSLARKADGYDTDDSSCDFVSQSNPTPGLSNPLVQVVDYALLDCEVNTDGLLPVFSTQIVNNSILAIDSLVITLEISFEGETIQSFDIQPIASGSTLPFTVLLSLPENPEGVLRVNLICPSDFNPTDNSWEYAFGTVLQTGCFINELLYNPATDNQEWIELAISDRARHSSVLVIEDASANHIQLDIPASHPQFLVVCKDKTQLLSRYPDCPAAAVCEVSSIPSLNNEGDKLYLKDSLDVVIDSMAYTGNFAKKDYSLERQVQSDSVVTWHYCYAAEKGTPGQQNSTAPPPPPVETGNIRLVNSPFNPLADESLRIQYNFKDEANYLSCVVYDLNGKKRHTIIDFQPVNKSGEITWNGRDRSGKALPRGIYILKAEARNSKKQYFLHKQLTVVLATK